MIRLLAASMLALAAVLLGGCCHEPGEYNIVVTLDPTLMIPGTKTFPPVTCQIVGVPTRVECDRQLSTTVSSQIGRGTADLKAASVLSFDPALTNGSHTVLKTDPMWKEWKSPRFLIVTANIPGLNSSQGGNLKDPRRVFFSTSKCRWEKSGGTIHIVILRDGIKPDPAEITPGPDNIDPDGF